MNSRLILWLLGVAGYLQVVWYYSNAFSPMPEAIRDLLWYSCVACQQIMGFHSARVGFAMLVLGPINALIFIAIGLVVRKFVRFLRRDN